MKPKLYADPGWLRNEYKVKHQTIEQIAARCGVATNTIRNALRKHGIK